MWLVEEGGKTPPVHAPASGIGSRDRPDLLTPEGGPVLGECGREVCGKEACGREVCGREVCGREICGKEACGREVCGREVCGKEACGMEVCGREVCGRVCGGDRLRKQSSAEGG